MEFKEHGDVLVIVTDERLDALVAQQFKDEVRQLSSKSKSRKSLSTWALPGS